MPSHPLARLTPLGRERLIRLHLEERVPLQMLAADAGISLRTAYKWLPRYLGIDNGRRCHMALGGLTPRQSLERLLTAE